MKLFIPAIKEKIEENNHWPSLDLDHLFSIPTPKTKLHYQKELVN